MLFVVLAKGYFCHFGSIYSMFENRSRAWANCGHYGLAASLQQCSGCFEKAMGDERICTFFK